MLVYPSIEEFMSECSSGCLVLMPAEILDFMSVHLDPRRLVAQDKQKARLLEAPFYVLEIEPYVPVLKNVSTKIGVEVSGEVTVPGTAETGKVSGSFSWNRETEELWKQDETMPGGTRVKSVVDQITSILEASSDAIRGRHVFLYVKRYSPAIVKTLLDIATVKSPYGNVPTSVALPVQLNKTSFLAFVRDLRSVIEDLKVVPVLLLGIDPLLVEEATDMKGREVISLPITRYLIMKILETTLPIKDAEERRKLAKEYTDTVISYMFDPAFEHRKRHTARYPFVTMALLPSLSWVFNHSVNTVFLDSLYSVATQATTVFPVKFPHSGLSDFAEHVARWAVYEFNARREILAKIVKRLGATEDTVNTVKSAGIFILRTGWSGIRVHEYSKWWKENVEQEVLETT